MDLTPPTSRTSPSSAEYDINTPPSCIPEEDLYASGSSALSYPSPAILEFAYTPVSRYSSAGPPSILETIEAEAGLEILESSTEGAWIPSDIMDRDDSHGSPNIPQILASGYNPFTTFQPYLQTSYPTSEAYPPPPSHTPALTHSPAPSAGTSALSNTISIEPRRTFGYDPRATSATVKIEAPSGFDQSFSSMQYAPADSIQDSYQAQHFVNNSNLISWSKEDDATSTALFTSPPDQPTSPEQPGSTGPPVRRQIRKHTTKDEANFQCQVNGCGKFFGRSYNYKSHMETHDEEREYPFPCPVDDCDKRFVRKTDLQRHHQSVHTSERNHRCDYCARLFARKDTLRRHMEGGCSLRFEFGGKDPRGQTTKNGESRSRVSRGSVDTLSSTSALLPTLADGGAG